MDECALGYATKGFVLAGTPRRAGESGIDMLGLTLQELRVDLCADFDDIPLCSSRGERAWRVSEKGEGEHLPNFCTVLMNGETFSAALVASVQNPLPLRWA